MTTQTITHKRYSKPGKRPASQVQMTFSIGLLRLFDHDAHPSRVHARTDPRVGQTERKAPLHTAHRVSRTEDKTDAQKTLATRATGTPASE